MKNLLHALALVVLGLVASVTSSCTPQPIPPSDGGVPAVTPSSWTRTAHLAATVGRGLLFVARPIVEATTQDPGRTQALRAMDASDDALAGLDRAVTAYDARGGDACPAYAAAGAAAVALHELTDVLADNGLAIGVPLGRVVDLVASVVDGLVPACQPDAGWASAGDRANDQIREREQRARLAGRPLRRDLDAIRLPEAFR